MTQRDETGPATESARARTEFDRIAACPRCKSELVFASSNSNDDKAIFCSSTECAYSAEGFPTVAGRPVLVDFENSVLSREGVRATSAASTVARWNRKSVFARARRALLRSSGPTGANVERFLAEAKRSNPNPVILVIGGGTIGADADALYRDPAVTLIGVDIYVTDLVGVVADGHQLPIKPGCVDGVWIQAVLEHVLSPEVVVAEIHRVLRPEGVVYAETPFLYPVHEGAYDFTRYTESGHRWLFRNFTEVASGGTRGPGTVAILALGHLAASVFRDKRAGSLAALAFFWLKYFDSFADPRISLDGASGVFFLGSRASTQAVTPRDMISYYKGGQR